MKPRLKYTFLTLAFLLCIATAAFANDEPKGLSGYIPGLTSGVGFLLWYFLRKDRIITPIAGAYPPEGLTPADAAYIMNGEVRSVDCLSFILYWAGKGYLLVSGISEKGGFMERKGLLLRKLREIGEEARLCEKELFDGMFLRGSDGQVTTFALAEGKFDDDLNKARKQIVNSYGGDSNPRIFKGIIMGGSIRALLVGSPTFVGMWYMIFAWFFRVNNAWVSALTALFFSFVFLNVLRMFRFALLLTEEFIDVPGLKLVLMLITMFAILFVSHGASFVMGRTFSFQLVLEMIDISAPLGLMYSCRHRTKLGLEYMARLLGLKNFIETAGSGLIYVMANENPKYFYDVLPYAMVLGVADKWAQKFERVALRPPEWYEDNKEGAFSASSFVSGFTERLSGVTKASRHA